MEKEKGKVADHHCCSVKAETVKKGRKEGEETLVTEIAEVEKQEKQPAN